MVVFNHRNFFFKHHDHFFHRGNGRFFSRDGVGRGNFFGTSATTNRSVAGLQRRSIQSPSVLRANRNSAGGSSVGLTVPRMSSRFATRQGNVIAQRNLTVSPPIGIRSTFGSQSQIMRVSGQQFATAPQIGSMGRSFGTVRGFAMSGTSAGWGHHGGSFGGGHGGGHR